MIKLQLFLGIFFLILNLQLHAEQHPGEFIPQNLTVAMNGKFLHGSPGGEDMPNSTNGRFWCRYEIAAATDEIRQIKNFQLFEDGRLCFQIAEIPGSDFYISNSGIVASLDTRQHFRNLLKIDFYSKQGQLLDTHALKGASQFGFSPSGKLFGVGNAKELLLISPESGQVTRLPGGFRFAISEDDQFVAVAGKNEIRVYSSGRFLRTFQTGFDYSRGLSLSARGKLVAVIAKHQLKVFSLETGQPLFTANLPARHSFRDLKIVQDKILTGVHFKEANVSTGLLRIYDLDGSFLLEKTESSQVIPVHHNLDYS